MPAPSIIPLRYRPELCELFARQFETEWPEWYGPGGQGNARDDLEAYANPDGSLPVGVIAIDDTGVPIGIAALRAASIATHAHLSPWASAGYVVPGRRRTGIGARLLSALLVEARRLGFHTIYCSTASAVSLLKREGWTQIDTVIHDGETQLIFRREVSAAPCSSTEV